MEIVELPADLLKHVMAQRWDVKQLLQLSANLLFAA